MKTYIDVEIKVITFSEEDVVRTSPVGSAFNAFEIGFGNPFEE